MKIVSDFGLIYIALYLSFPIAVFAVFESEPLFTIKWFDSKASFFDSYVFKNEQTIMSKKNPEENKDQGIELQALKRFENFPMRSKDNSNFDCYLPSDKHLGGSQKPDYEGPSPIELLEDLFIGETCSYLITSYWVYQVCHGKHFRQYHEENKKLQEYYLGKLDGFWQSEQFTDVHYEKRWPKNLIKSMQVDETSRAYVEVTMKDGTPCDIKNNDPRMVHVRYMCVPNTRLELFDIREVASCNYEALISVPSLCSHPDFAPSTPDETPLYCVALDKPVKLPDSNSHKFHLILGDEIYEEPFPSSKIANTASTPLGNSKTAGQISIKDASDDDDVDLSDDYTDPSSDSADAEDSDYDDAESDGSDSKVLVSTLFKSVDGSTVVKRNDDSSPRPPATSTSTNKPPYPTTNAAIAAARLKQLNLFLDAIECVKGGRGWWKHEFCYQRHIFHLHYEKKPKTDVLYIQQKIVLGVWDHEEHIKWTKTQTKENYRNVGPGVANPSVTLYYGQGDICHELDDFRHTFVKLKCLSNAVTSTFISVSLIEPALCSYVLLVESGIFCDLLKNVDQYGIPIRAQASEGKN